MTEQPNSKEKNIEKREANLIHFKPGESGNPRGRAKGQRDYATIYREALLKLAEINNKTPEELEDELIAGGFANAKKDYRFYKDVLDRLHGTPVQKVDHTTKGESFNPEVIKERATTIFNDDKQG